jgi:membrane protein implicated in regulation of membrane protease activity
MTWWAWIISGVVLLGAELGFVNAQFYLVFLGAAAILTGAGVWILGEVADGLQWIAFALIAVGSMFGFRKRLYLRLRGGATPDESGPVGGILALPQALAPGETCRVEHGGSYWTLQNDSRTALDAGAKVRVERVQNLTLLVRPES